MSFGVMMVAVQTYIQLRFYYRDINSLRHSEPQEIRGKYKNAQHYLN